MHLEFVNDCVHTYYTAVKAALLHLCLYSHCPSTACKVARMLLEMQQPAMLTRIAVAAILEVMYMLFGPYAYVRTVLPVAYAAMAFDEAY